MAPPTDGLDHPAFKRRGVIHCARAEEPQQLEQADWYVTVFAKYRTEKGLLDLVAKVRVFKKTFPEGSYGHLPGPEVVCSQSLPEPRP